MGILNKKIKQKWLKALRSGKYRQTRTGQLYSEPSNAYCCLGVLQHCLTGNVEDDTTPSTEWYIENGIPPLNDMVNLDDKLRKNIDLGNEWNIENKLVQMNDKSKYNFAKIADWIEKNL
jgi:hypothetical protein